jgi:tetratricopeptide (TPR) repeat protein
MTSTTEEILNFCARDISRCWELGKGNGNEIILARSAISSYIPTLISIATKESPYQALAADQTAQCYRLEAILGYHLESLSIAEEKAKNAVTYSKIAGDPNLIVTSLVLQALIYYYMDRPEKGLEKCQEASLHLNQASHAVHSYYYRTQAACLAQIGQETAALTSIDQAHENFMKHPKSEKPFMHAAHDRFELALWDGITRCHIGQHSTALQSLESANPFSKNIPERIRTGFLNNLVLTQLQSDDRDIEQCISTWTEAMKSAIDLKSELRFTEATQAYKGMIVAFPREQKIKQLRPLIRRWDQETGTLA